MKCGLCGVGQEPDEAPIWALDPVVLRFGWLDGRCPRCGETSPAAGEESDPYTRYTTPGEARWHSATTPTSAAKN